jgi:hypothetical protein
MMAKVCKWVGVTLFAVGLAMLASFSVSAIRSVRGQEFQRAKLLRDRNPGNDMYALEYSLKHVAPVVGLVALGFAGGLVALNGATLFLVGQVAANQQREPSPSVGAER